MTVIEFIHKNPNWLTEPSHTRIRTKLSTGEKVLICADCFIDATNEFWKEMSESEFMTLEKFGE